LRRRLSESLRAFAEVFANPDLRRVELAWSGSVVGQWGYEVALAVFAYRAGGATAVGLVALVRPPSRRGRRTVRGAARRPLPAQADHDRGRPRPCLRDGRRAVAVFAGAPAVVVYALAVLTALASTAFGPAQSALLPSLARSPEELTAANATSTTLESVGFLPRPLRWAACCLASPASGPSSRRPPALFLWSALVLSRISADSQGDPSAEVESIGREALAGFRAILGERRCGSWSASTGRRRWSPESCASWSS
jgi:hypothetical protein